MDGTFLATAPAASSPDITENGGDTGYTGYAEPKPAEISRFDAAEPVTPDDGTTGYTGYAEPDIADPAGDAATRAARDAAAVASMPASGLLSDTPDSAPGTPPDGTGDAVDPFAALTDADRARIGNTLRWWWWCRW